MGDPGYQLLWLLVAGYSAAVVCVAWFVRLWFPPVRLPNASFGRPFSRLAVHVDLPRLSLAVNGRQLGKEADARLRVGTFLEEVCRGVGAESEGRRLRAACADVERVEMLCDKLLVLLESVSDARAKALFKCCTQSLVASHALRAKNSQLARQSPYNSVPGTWQCEVDTEQCQVTHEKTERGREGEYEFSWQCVFAIGRRGELLRESAFVSSSTCLDRSLTALIRIAFD
jgi:hypothetical protein